VKAGIKYQQTKLILKGDTGHFGKRTKKYGGKHENHYQ
jgi:hypothetical protein